MVIRGCRYPTSPAFNVPNGGAAFLYGLFSVRLPQPHPFSNCDILFSLSVRLAGPDRLARSLRTIV